MRHILTLLMVAVLASTSFAQETATKEKKEKKTSWQIKRIEKLLAPVTWTPEQQTSFDEAKKKLTEELAAVRESGLTSPMLKSRDEKRKEGRESELKGKELADHVTEGLTEEQIEMFKTYDMSIKTFEKAVAGMLSDEQKSALSEKAQKRVKAMMSSKGGKGGKGGKRKGKKKMEDASEDE